MRIALAISAFALMPSPLPMASRQQGEHGPAISAATRASLLAFAQSSARRNGDSGPYDIQVVQTTATVAARIHREPNDVPSSGPGPAIYLIAMRGRFNCATCKPPRGAAPPHGSVIVLELPVATPDTDTGFSLGNRYPALAAAGTPVRLRGVSVSSDLPETLTKGGCDEPLLPGEPAPPCPPELRGGRERTQLRIDNRHPSDVLAWASPQVENTGAPGVSAKVNYAIFLDGRPIVERTITLDGSQHTQIPLDAPVRIPAGRHTLGFEAFGVSFSSREPGEVIVAPVSLVALTLPQR